MNILHDLWKNQNKKFETRFKYWWLTKNIIHQDHYNKYYVKKILPLSMLLIINLQPADRFSTKKPTGLNLTALHLVIHTMMFRPGANSLFRKKWHRPALIQNLLQRYHFIQLWHKFIKSAQVVGTWHTLNYPTGQSLCHYHCISTCMGSANIVAKWMPYVRGQLEWTIEVFNI